MKNIKGILRKVTVMVVMLSLVCQLLPLSAGAASDALVPDAKTEENVATVSKTAERIADDKWEVTLSVEALQDLYTKPLELVILYDISGSMAWCAQEEHSHSIACRKNGCEKTAHRHSILAGNLCKGTTVEQSRQYILGTALREFVVDLNENVEGASVSVCTFGNKGYTDVPMTELSDASVDVICDNIPVQYQRRAELTNIRSGILNAQKQFSDNPNTTKMMLILCDGEYTGSLPAVAANNLKANGVIIDCVGFLYTSDTLETLASEGHYHHVEDGIDLDVVLSSYLDMTSAMITDTMGDAVEFVQIESVTDGECLVSDDLTSWSWVPEGGVLASGEKAEITYTVQLKDEYIVAGEHDIALNNSAVLTCAIANGTEYAVDFPVPMAHYEVGSLAITTSGLPAEIAPEAYYDEMITDFTAKQFTFDAAAPSYTAADGTVYYYVNSEYTDKDGNVSAFDGLTTEALDAVSGAQSIVHYYDVAVVAEEFVVSYIYGGAVPFGVDPLPAPEKYAVGETVVIADKPADVRGFVFLGWVVLGADEADGQFTMPANHVVVKGVWAKELTPPAIKYSVSYVYTGIVPVGAPLPPSIKFYNQLKPGIEVEDVPVMDDYVFVGWFTLTAFVVDGQFTMPMHHVVFYGHWVPKAQYKVEYKYEGDVPAEADPLPDDAWYKAGEKVDVAPRPAEVEGYTFKGWYVIGANGFGGDFLMPHHNVIIKGIWEKNEAPETEPDVTVPDETDPVPEDTDPIETDPIETDPMPEDTDPVETDPIVTDPIETDPEPEETDPVETDPEPDPVVYNVIYKYEGEVPENAPALPADAQYAENDEVVLAGSPELEGYIFKGWTVADVDVADGKFAMPANDVTVVGVWEKAPAEVITYTVVYQDGVETVEITVPEGKDNIIAGSDYTISSDIPVYEGFTFNGWISSVDGQLYNPGDTITVNSDVILVASWSESENPETADAFTAAVLMCLCACAVIAVTAKAKRAR